MNRPTRVAQQQGEDQYIDQMSDQTGNLPAQREQSNNQPMMPEIDAAPPPVLPTTGFANLATAIAAVMEEIKPVEKAGWNDFHKYQYAKMQDLSRELTPLMGKHGIVIFQTEEGREMFDGGAAIAVRYRFTIVHKSGEIWPEHPIQTGLSACRANNGKFDDKAINKCHTSARKYFLLSLFQIPTADEDDADSGGNDKIGTHGHSSRPRRQVPGPNGKVRPHIIAVVSGEHPAEWAKRFIAFINKAETDAEIDDWYNTNGAVMEKIRGHEDSQEVLDSIVDAMDARAAALTNNAFAQVEKPADVVKPTAATATRAAPTRAPPQPKGGDIPDIPSSLRRTAPKPKPDAPSVESVEEFFGFISQKIEDAPDMDAVQIVWDTYVFPHIDGEGHRDTPKILPPDLDAIYDLVDQKKELLGL